MLRHSLTLLALILLGAAVSSLLAADEAPKRDSLGQVNAVAYSPDGRALATGSGSASERGTLVLWDILTGKARVWLPQPLGVRSVAFSPDGGKIAAGGWDKLIRIYDTRTAKLLTTLKGHEAVVNSLAFSPDGKTLASCGLDKIVILWDPAKGMETHRLTGHNDWVLSLAFFPDGKSLASAGKDGTVRIWDVEAGKERQTLKDAAASAPFEAIAVSPDGKTIASGSWNWKVYLWDVEKGAIRATLSGHNLGVLSLSFSPDGKTLASTSGNSTKAIPGDIRLWTMPNGDEKARWDGNNGNSIWSVRFAPDGRTLATAGADQRVKIWETATGKERATLENGLLLFEATAPPAPTDKELEESWKALAGADGAAAQLAIARLARSPNQSVPWLAKRMKPAVKTDTKQGKSVQEWIVKLDDDDFGTREKAAEELAKMGATIRPSLQKALDNASSAEVRQRLTGLLEKLGNGGSDPDALRGRRALEALELIHSDAAKDLLKELANGDPDAELTREAEASCRRLAKRP